RKRVGLMEHDPFSPLEGSKRRVTTATRTAAPEGNGAQQGSGPTAPPPGGTGTNITGPNTPSGSFGTPTDTTGGSAPGGNPAGPPAAGTQGGARSVVVAPTTVPAPTLTGGKDAGSGEAAPLSVQLRNLLDPATLGELRRIESSG